LGIPSSAFLHRGSRPALLASLPYERAKVESDLGLIRVDYPQVIYCYTIAEEWSLTSTHNHYIMSDLDHLQ
jgi:hypothetical protein